MEIINLSNIKASTIMGTGTPQGVSFNNQVNNVTNVNNAPNNVVNRATSPVTRTPLADATCHNKQAMKQDSGLLSSVLRRARKDSGISISEASQQLFIKERQLKAIEDERFDDLPQYAFSRGFAIKYGTYLGLNAEDVGNRFDRVYPTEMKIKQLDNVVSPVQPMGTVNRDGKLNININPSLLAASVAVIALAVSLMRVVSDAEAKQNAPEPIQETISSIEQRQGASLTNTSSLGGISVAGNITPTNN